MNRPAHSSMYRPHSIVFGAEKAGPDLHIIIRNFWRISYFRKYLSSGIITGIDKLDSDALFERHGEVTVIFS